MSQKQLTREFFQRAGRKGGLKAARRTTPEQRRARGLKGMQRRWSKQTEADLLRLAPLVRDLTSDCEPHPGHCLAIETQAGSGR